jgi:hypothetical protein
VRVTGVVALVLAALPLGGVEAVREARRQEAPPPSSRAADRAEP